MVNDGSGDRDPAEVVAEEFMERLRQGERPSISEYKSRYPQLAEDIEDIFPALAMMHEIDPSTDESSRPRPSANEVVPKLEKLGDFRIIREVGRGGMGLVYEAEQVSLGRHVALKVLPSSALPDSKHVSRFEREARSAAKLHHTNIVPVFGVGEQEGMHYYVMQFIQGLPLDEVIGELKKFQAQPTGTTASSVSLERAQKSGRQQSAADVAHTLMTGQFAETYIGPSDSDEESSEAIPAAESASAGASEVSTSRISETLNLSGSLSSSTMQLGKSGVQSALQKKLTYWQSVAHIGAQVADALQYAHEQGILHRDIKPSNLLLDLRGTTWVTDFGLAKATDQQDITHTGDILGTLRYMPPEAFDGAADARSDIYSLGLTLYELLAFRPAFRVKERNQLIKQVTTESAPRLDKLNPQIPRDLVTIVHKAVDRDPALRYQTAEELQHDLQRFIDDEPIKARRISSAERLLRWARRNRGLAAATSLVCVLLLVLGVAVPITYRISKLNDELKLSQSVLLDTIDDLGLREQQLKRTGNQLQFERDRANREADRANREAGEVNRQRAITRRALYSLALITAQQAIAERDYARARQLLDEVRPQSREEDLRGWEWHYLYAQLLSPDGIVRRDSSGYPAAVNENPASDFAAHQKRIPWLAWSRDGSRLATASVDKTVKIWDAATRKLLTTFQEHTHIVHSVDWDAEGTRLVSCGHETFFHVWDAGTGEVLHTINATDHGMIFAVAWSPDGTMIASAGEDGTLRVFDSETEVEVGRFNLRLGIFSRALDWSHDGSRLAAATTTGDVKVWDVATRDEIAHFRNPDQALYCIRFSPDGTKLVAGGETKPQKGSSHVDDPRAEGTVTVWELNTEQAAHHLHGHTDKVRAVDWSADGGRLISAGHDGQIIVWDTTANEQLLVVRDPESNPVLSAQFSPDELQIASAGDASGVHLWDATASYAADLSEKLLPGLDRRITDEPTTDNIDDLLLRGRILAKQGQWNSSKNNFARAARLRTANDSAPVWFATPWWIIGPYPERLDEEQPPESHLDPLSPVPSVNTRAGNPLIWESRVPGENRGVDLRQFFHEAERNSGYVQLRIYSPKEQHIGVLFGAEDSIRLWFNDKLIYTRQTPRNAVRDDEAVDVLLKADVWNTLLVKVSNSGGEHRLFLRLSDDPVYVAGVLARNGKWAQSLAAWNRAYAERPDDPDVLLGRGRAALAEGEIDIANQSFDAVLADNERFALRGVASAYAAHARSLFDQGRAHDAANSRDQARRFYETLLSGDQPEIQDATALVDILLAGNTTDWTVLDPVEMTSAGGATLSLQNDGSILASGVNPKHDTYRIVARRDSTRIRSLLLELIPIAPGRGIGRGTYDNFILSNVLLKARNGTAAGKPLPLAISDAAATYAEESWGISNAIDDVSGTAWAVFPHVSERQSAVFRIQDNGESVDYLEIELECRHPRGWTGAHSNIGRFRLSVSDDPAAFDNNARRFKVSRIKDPWERLGAAYAALGDSDRAAQWLARSLELTPEFTDRRALVKRIERLRTDFDDLVVLRPDEPLLLGALAKQQFAAGQEEAAFESIAVARRLTEALMAKFPDDEALADFLADLILAETRRSVSWKMIHPKHIQSKNKEQFTVEDDGSIFVSGPNPERATYTLTLPLGERPVHAIRLESLPDARLPHGGAGRYPANGNFHVSEVTVATIASTASGVDPTPVEIAGIEADDRKSAEFAPANMIDGNPYTRWEVYPRQTEHHEAIIGLKAAVRPGVGHLQLTLDSGSSKRGRHGLGHFRLAVTNDPAVIPSYRRLLSVMNKQNPWLKLGLAYSLEGNSNSAARCFARLLDAETGFMARLDLLEQIAELQPDLSQFNALRPGDPLLELMRWRRRFGERDDTIGDEHLVEDCFEFLENSPEVDLRSLYKYPEFRSIVDRDSFEQLLEGRFEEPTFGVRQQVWTKQPPEPVIAHLFRSQDYVMELVDNLQARGLRPAFVSTSPSPDGPDFVTIWTNDGRDHRIELGLTRQEFDDLLETPPDGMQLVCVEEYARDTSTLYAALWVKQLAPTPWELHERLSESETVKLAGAMRDRGFRPTYLNVYPDGTLTTIWIKDDGDSELLLGLTYQDLKELERGRAADCLPIGIDSYYDGTRRRYGVIIDNSVTGAEWKFMLLVQRNEFQTSGTPYFSAGWRPIGTTESPVPHAPETGN